MKLRGKKIVVLVAEGAADRPVRDTGTAWIMGFHDPDGFYAEVIWRKPGVAAGDVVDHADWKTVELT